MSKRKKGIAAAPAMRKKRRRGGKPAPDKPRPARGTLRQLAEEWARHLETLAYSPRTLRGHRWAIEVFCQWAGERGITRPGQVDRPRLQAHQRHLARLRRPGGLPLGVSSQKQRLASVKRFFAWLVREGRIPANPASDLEMPRVPPRRLPRGLSREELAALLSVPDTGDPMGVRDRAILETLYASGARRRELCLLDLPDLDPAGGTLHVRHGKGQKERLVPIGQNALRWLDRYLLECRPLLTGDPAEQALFLSGYGERITPGHLGNWVKKALLQAGIDRPGSCHLLRHAAATHMLEGGADSRLVQQFLGHAKADTTALYTQVAIESLKAAYHASHPSASGEGAGEGKAGQ